MPQLFQVLKCYKCLVFQVHQTKKSNKWECKMCGEKQSIKRHYGLGTGKECRLHVQKLNGIRGETDEQNVLTELNRNSDEELENNTPNTNQEISVIRNSNESIWSKYIEETEPLQTDENERMYLGNTEVVLEIPTKKRKKFKHPTATVESTIFSNKSQETVYSIDSYKPVSDFDSDDHLYNYKTNKSVCGLATSESASLDANTFSKNKSWKSHKAVSNSTVPIKEYLSHNNLTKQYIPPKLNTTSKWAAFIDEKDDSVSNEDNLIENISQSQGNVEEHIFQSQDKLAENISPSKQEIKNISQKAKLPTNATSFFSLCEDNELDDILEI